MSRPCSRPTLRIKSHERWNPAGLTEWVIQPSRDGADARERKLRAAGLGLALRKPLGVGGQPDRTRRLQRLGFERDVRELRELARELLVVFRPQVPQDVDVLDHPLA